MNVECKREPRIGGVAESRALLLGLRREWCVTFRSFYDAGPARVCALQHVAGIWSAASRARAHAFALLTGNSCWPLTWGRPK
eukprot:1157496-Pelagomonas_calceolata.AAC.3